jgi:hypothetical protein
VRKWWKEGCFYWNLSTATRAPTSLAIVENYFNKRKGSKKKSKKNECILSQCRGDGNQGSKENERHKQQKKKTN